MTVSIVKRKAVKPAAHLKAFADRRRDPGTKREAVLHTALQLFMERGYWQTSLNHIADKLKITKPALYHYFHSKEDIYVECYRRGIALVEEDLQQIRRHPGTGLDKVGEFIQRYAGLITRDFGRFLVRQDDRDLSGVAKAEVRRCKRSIDHHLREFIQQGIEDKSIRNCNVKLAAFCVAGAVNSMVVWFSPSGDLTAEQVAAELARTLTQGLVRTSE
jgi:AcrR family transcriptional regulator